MYPLLNHKTLKIINLVNGICNTCCRDWSGDTPCAFRALEIVFWYRLGFSLSNFQFIHMATNKQELRGSLKIHPRGKN